MNIRFNQDGSVDNIAVNQFVNQLSSGQKIGVFVTGLAANEFTARAYGVLPNGDSTIISCVPVDGSNYWEITLNTANTAYAGKLTITVQIILNQTNYVFTYPLYLTVNPTIPGNVEFPITLDEVTTFLTQLQNYPTKAAADARFQRKYDINTLRVYNSLARAEEDSNILANQYILVRTAPGEFSIYVKNTNSTFTKISIDEAAKALKDGDGNIITTYYLPRINFTTFQNDLEEGHIVVGNAEKASKKTGTDDELATERYVDNKIGTLSAHYVTYDIYGNSFPTKAALLAGPYYYGIDIHEPDDNDYAFVDADETHDGKPARYVYQYNTWNFQYVIPTPVAGVTDVKVDGESVLNPQKVANINLTGKQDKIVVESDSDITIGGLAVPKLTVEQVETIYNHLISGNSVVVSSDDGIKHFSPIVADYLDGAAIHFLYCNLLITYYIENDTVKNEYIDLDNVVHKTGDEEISGVKNFTGTLQVKGNSVENGLIKEINTQNIRIWNLDVGIYKLTYNGTKYLYYNGATGTQTRSLNTGVALLQITNDENGQKSWLTICTGPFGGSYYGKTTATTGEFTQTYNFSPIYKVNKSTLVPDIFAPITKGENGQVLISDGSNTPKWDYLKPYTMIYTIDLASSNTITIDIRNDFPMFNGRDDILVEIMPQDMLDEWVENNVTFEEGHPGYFYDIVFTADSTLSAPVKVLVKAQVKGTI